LFGSFPFPIVVILVGPSAALQHQRESFVPMPLPPNPILVEAYEVAHWVLKLREAGILERDFCQDPDTGLLCGSDPSGGSDSSSGGGKTGGKEGGKGGKDKVKIESVSKFRKDGVKVSTSSEKEFLEVWNDKIGMEPAEFKSSFMGKSEGEMTLSLRSFNIDPAKGTREHYLEISGKVKDGGKTVGEFTRTIDVKKNTASSDVFEINKEAQSKGLAKKLLAGNVATYRELGLKHVETHANIDVGGYAWAKYGYVPDKGSWTNLKNDILQDKLEALPARLAADRPWLGKLVNSSDPKAIWAIADSPYGKYFLLGSDWKGKLVFDDNDSMTRFDAYVGKKK
jgi:hypothetical protein